MVGWLIRVSVGSEGKGGEGKGVSVVSGGVVN